MLPLPPERLEPQHIRDLVGRAENLGLELKRELPHRNDEGTAEFLKDVSALANVIGGSIAYGVDENEGVATRITGVGDINVDEACLRLRNLIATGISPEIPSIEISPLEIGGVSVVVIRIIDSPLKPHRVVFKSRSRYYLRHGTGVREMSDGDIRFAFNRSSFLAQKMDGIIIRPQDLHLAGQAGLVNKNISNCIFKGPASLVLGANNMRNTRFSGCQAVILERDDQNLFIKTAGIVGCDINNCIFMEIILILPPFMYESLSSNVHGFAASCTVISDGRRSRA